MANISLPKKVVSSHATLSHSDLAWSGMLRAGSKYYTSKWLYPAMML